MNQRKAGITPKCKVSKERAIAGKNYEFYILHHGK